MKDLSNKHFGFKLRRLREEKGVSQQTLAIDLEVSQSKVSKIENGTEAITLSYLIKIFTYLSMTSNEMIEFLDLVNIL